MAIIARWRMPPLYWWGYCLAISGVIPTISSNSSTRSLAYALSVVTWSMIASAI